ncbi:unnamed protein product [Cuscuta epithymum]|uniref:RING-type domain-containing protein n=1 Tax=Cuscuta epithymum TaxID=186058 RepID=A0AAV0EUM0_9ASTE|nr:unnamed protein product [Cuscuta epithymum]
MSSSFGDNLFDYSPPQRYMQGNDYGSFTYGPPCLYSRTRTQYGFPQFHQQEESIDWNTRNRTQPGYPNSLLSEPTDWYRNRIQPEFYRPEGPPSFQNNQNGFFQHSRSSLITRRVIEDAMEAFDALPPQRIFPPPTRTVAFEDRLSANSFPTQPRQPARHSPPPAQWSIRPHGNPQNQINQSKLTADGQEKVLCKLKKEKYNPAARTAIPKERDENWKRCSVCLEDFEPREEVTLTPCRHMFHEDCIVPWVTKEGSCPVCRFAVIERRPNRDSSARANSAPQDNSARDSLATRDSSERNVNPREVDRALANGDPYALLRALRLDDVVPYSVAVG